MVIGLTGGIGCGKSAAAAVFGRLGFQVTDADRLARQVLESASCLASLRARWGEACVGPDGRPDRAWIARKVFGSPDELAFLESVTHPEVSRLRQAAVADRARAHVVEIPLLFEKNLGAEFDAVVCVASSDEVRLSRLEGRGVARDEAQRRMSSQLPLGEKVKKADFVIWNDGDLSFLEQQVSLLVEHLRTAFPR